MNALILRNSTRGNTTIIENDFIDHYMASANGEYVKVYLLLLRHLHDREFTLSISAMADFLEFTERDIVRALRYWEKTGLLSLETDEFGSVIGVEFCKCSVQKTGAQTQLQPAAASAPAAAETATLRRHSPEGMKELRQILFIASQYIGKPLTATEAETITYFYDTLHFSADLIEYLIEYCVENGHKNFAYIQKVALAWAEQNITTAEEAKATSALYNKTCYSILTAFGIRGRGPATKELEYIRKWTEEYAFDLEIILEAVNRTVNAIHQPGFEYADRILTNWHKQNVHSLRDIQALDLAFEKSKQTSPAKPAQKNTAVNRFEEHSYDMDALTRSLLAGN